MKESLGVMPSATFFAVDWTMKMSAPRMDSS